MDIIKLLDNALLEEQNKDYTIKSHWPSNASCIVDGKVIGRCLRAQWYGWKGYKPSDPFSLNALWIMFMGKCIHLGVQRMFERLSIPTKTEERVEYKAKNISGRIDILFLEEDEGIYSGLEIKSTYGRAIIDPINGVKYAGPKLHNIVQCLPYMMNDEFPYVIPYYILYLARDTGWRECFYLNYDSTKDMLLCEGRPTGITWAGVLQRWEELEKYLQKGELPPRDYQLCYSDDYWKPIWEKYRETTRAKRPLTFKQYKLDKDTGKNKGDWECKRCLHKTTCWRFKRGVKWQGIKLFIKRGKNHILN